MFAGGSCTFHAPLRYGEVVHRRLFLREVNLKSGRSGDLLFVSVRSVLSQAGSVCVVEDQDIVYRSGPSAADWRDIAPATGQPSLPDGAEHLALRTDPVLLFRMSALTANQHRIHYDEAYAREVEQYPALVVQGPLLVLHMLEIPRRRAGESLAKVSYRLHAPAFVGEPLLAVSRRSVTDPRTQELSIATTRNPRHASAELRW